MPSAGTARRNGGRLRRTPGNAASRAARILQRTLRTPRRKHHILPRQTRCRAPCRHRRAGIPVHNSYRARCSAASASGRLPRDRQPNSGRKRRRSRNMLECILRTVDEPLQSPCQVNVIQPHSLQTRSANGVRRHGTCTPPDRRKVRAPGLFILIRHIDAAALPFCLVAIRMRQMD